MQCVKFGLRARQSARTGPGHDSGLAHRREEAAHGVRRASGEFKFEDGDGLEVDCVIYCTGYRTMFLFPTNRCSSAREPPRAGALEGDRPPRLHLALLRGHAGPVLHVHHVRRAGPLRAGLPRGPGGLPD